MTGARAVLLVLDGLPHRHVNEHLTPNLMRLAAMGGIAPTGGRAVLTSATYPNHATFVTGKQPARHGITANFVVRNDTIVGAETAGPAVPTVFELGVQTAAVFGDQNLVGVTNARRATTHWPPDGAIPVHAAVTTDGYIADESVVPQLLAALASDADIVVAQLNGPDTAGHLYGPDSDEATDAYHHTDRCLVDVIEALRPRWDETFLAVVSDHDQVTVTNHDCIDLWSPLRERELQLTVLPEGDAALVIGPDPTNGGWLDDVEGVDEHESWYDGSRLAHAERGRVFGWGTATLNGIHGGRHTRTQVAVVAGGHHLVAPTATAISHDPPAATMWAPLLARAVGAKL
jgi:predicted AlkP superfamily pyrophosphatase or phosphodiesterase